MTEITEKEVDFFRFCPLCKHKNKNGTDDPCNECLSHPANTGTIKPVKYEKA
jgi:hypothetical protein